MALIEGQGMRPRTRFWRGPDLHDYHDNRVLSGGRISLRCVNHKQCPGHCSVFRDRTEFRETTCHNHDPNVHRLQVRSLRYALMERCRRGDQTRFKKMYAEERVRLKISAQAASRIPLVKLRTAMRRARLENRPRLPRSLKDLDKILRQGQYKALSCSLDGKDSVYAGRAGSARQKNMSLIFVSKRMLREMNRRKTGKVKELFCDATSCPTPRGLKVSQVWNISTVRSHHVIPLVRVLMRKRTKEAYLAALEKIKSLAPRLNPQKIMTDYESAEQWALGRAFLNAELHGCLFHYSKAIGAKARKLGMYKVIKKNYHVRSLVRWLTCLPSLPVASIKKGLREIARRAVKKGVAEHMVKLLQYWVRTTNASESDNRMLQDAVSVKRPNVWDFIGGVIEMEDATYCNLKVLRNPVNRLRRRPLSALANDRTIQALTEDLDAGNISVRKFIKVASYTTLRSLNRGLNGKKRKRNI
ncbi:Dihydroorotase-like protein [Frankliniella fusca]|uniref:Dihydroorotase-like protein n=1 Tax=Frankliniella fusca TaxID=407009 RepID=A0AAE1I1G5_9NEOP|nr:Dihydroorotase-like protein [Frankliniella fusca]